jgi:hypothetical protein
MTAGKELVYILGPVGGGAGPFVITAISSDFSRFCGEANMLSEYEFEVTIKGQGDCPESAFADAMDQPITVDDAQIVWVTPVSELGGQ